MFFYEKWDKCNMDYVVFMDSVNEHFKNVVFLSRYT